MSDFDPVLRDRFLNLLQEIRFFDTRGGRDALLANLPRALVVRIERSESLWFDLTRIVDACANWKPRASDPNPLYVLVQNASEAVRESQLELDLQKWWVDYEASDRSKTTQSTSPQEIGDVIAGLSEEDCMLMKLIGEYAIERNSTFGIDTASLVERTTSLGVPEDQIFESLEVLDGDGYIEGTKTFGVRYALYFSITVQGFDKFVRAYVQDYQRTLAQVCSLVLDEEKNDSKSIASISGVPEVLIKHIFDVLESNKLIKVEHLMGQISEIFYISPKLKRIVKDNSQDS